MKKNSLQEKFLIFKVKYSKDADAYGRLYDYYIDRIYRFVFFKVSNVEDAQDITADVFLKTWQYIRNSEKRIDNLNALLYRMARNAVIDFYRRRSHSRTVIAAEEQFKQIMDNRSVEADVENKIKLEKFEQALNHIKDEYREVIILKHVEGFSINEIALILKKTKNNVRVLLHRGLKKIRELAGEQ